MKTIIKNQRQVVNSKSNLTGSEIYLISDHGRTPWVRGWKTPEWNILVLLLILYLVLRFMQTDITAAETDAFLPGGAWEQDIGREIQIRTGYGSAEDDTDAKETINAEANGITDVEFDPIYDPRNEGLVTDVKDQGMTALCWDYACNSTAESVMIKQGMCDSSVDLSEFHTAFFAFLDQKEKGNIPLSFSFSDFCNDGGRLSYVWEIWQEGVGPAEEEEYPMPESVSENTILPAGDGKEHIKMLSTVTRLRTDLREDIKQAIRDKGAVVALYYSYRDYYRDAVNEQGDSSYYMPYDVKTCNHAISIVGWDDDFPAQSFVKDFIRIRNDEETEDIPLQNGAWLVKNSWEKKAYRTPDEASGYYWISYYDKSLTEFTAITFENLEDNVYIIENTIEESQVEPFENEYENQTDKPVLPFAVETKLIEIQDQILTPAIPVRTELSVNKGEKPTDCKQSRSKTVKKKKARKIKAKTVKVKGIVYRLRNRKATVVRVLKKKKKVRIPAYVKYKGRRFKVTGISEQVFRKNRLIQHVFSFHECVKNVFSALDECVNNVYYKENGIRKEVKELDEAQGSDQET